MSCAAPSEFERVLRVRAETSQLAAIRRFVEEVAAEVELDIERVFDLKVAVSEACANAFEHAGCGSSWLEICAHCQPRRLTFVITDRGLFRPPTVERRQSPNRGLGLPLMVALMDEVSFARAPGGGTTVSLTVLREGDTALTA
jgi:serine/threonine-protein kinase RsbW